jgi:phosphotriesterase-related protein
VTTDYQTSLAERGAFIEYDMLGMDYWYADQHVQCPSDEDNARAIASLIAAGYIDACSSPRTSFSR